MKGAPVKQAREGGSPWRFEVKRKPDATVEERARAIVGRLHDDPELARRVQQLLRNEDVRTSRRKNGVNTRVAAKSPRGGS